MMASVSLCLDDTVFLYGFIAQVRVTARNIGAATVGHNVNAATTTARQVVKAKQLAKWRGIGLKTAENTIHITTQQGICHPVHPLIKRSVKEQPVELSRLFRHFVHFYQVYSNTRAQIFVTDTEFSLAFPMRSKAESYLGFKHFTRDVEMPGHHTDVTN
jgi:hypothetical protein